VNGVGTGLEDIGKLKDAAATVALFTRNAKILSTASWIENIVGSSGSDYIPIVSGIINNYKYSTGQISTGEYYVQQTGVMGGIMVSGQVGTEFGGAYGGLAGLAFGTSFEVFYQSGQQQAQQTVQNSTMFQPAFSPIPFGY